MDVLSVDYPQGSKVVRGFKVTSTGWNVHPEGFCRTYIAKRGQEDLIHGSKVVSSKPVDLLAADVDFWQLVDTDLQAQPEPVPANTVI